MPIYHINIRTGSHIATQTEFETESLTDLRLEMARFVGNVMMEHAEQIWVNEDWQVDVTDAKGLILYVIHVSASGTSATAGTLPRKRP